MADPISQSGATGFQGLSSDTTQKWFEFNVHACVCAVVCVRACVHQVGCACKFEHTRILFPS